MKVILKLSLIFFSFCTYAQSWQMKQAPLMTSYANDVDPENVLPEYPRPQLKRDRWLNLNGIWQYQAGLGSQEPFPVGQLDGTILVPFAVESAISGVMEHHPRIWYRRNFNIPESWQNQRVRINFGAVDYESEVYINGQSMGTHQGGYDSFSYDITDYLNESGENELTVRVFDPTDAAGYPRGKQTLYPGGIMYTSVTGIWQTVWLEPVAETAISTLKLTPDIDEEILKLTVNTASETTGLTFKAFILEGENQVQTIEGAPNQELHVSIPNPKLWSPTTPFLYDLQVILLQDGEPVDSVSSYFGMRKISLNEADGYQKLFLNNEFLFQHGPLDQGYWPDGLYTAPTDEALKYDIEMIKELGFNMVRKHIKVEPARWYYWADKLGVMVWQDMPSANSYTNNPAVLDEAAYKNELNEMVTQLWNSPSIIMWVIFNEGQGQHKTVELVNNVKALDPSRMVNEASGWEHFGSGHVLDIHSYPAPACPESTEKALACGEFGGVGYEIPNHIWNEGFGYVMANNEEEYLDYYETYMEMLTLFKTNNGLSAAVYTEITDVEVELNGLMTYDRLLKADLERIKNANKQVIEQDIFLAEVISSSKNEAQTWKYTTTTPNWDWYKETFDDSAWKTGDAGFGTDGTPGAKVRTIWNTSDIWIRRKVSVGDLSGIDRNNLVLYIHHDEGCEVYINGKLATTTTGWTTGYIHLPLSSSGKEALKSNSENTIAIHCTQTAGGQYIDAGLSLISYNEPAPEIPTSTKQLNSSFLSDNALYPNPASDTIRFLKSIPQPVEASIVDSDGRVVKVLHSDIQEISVSELKPGIYFLHVKYDHMEHDYKFIKQ